MKWNKSALSLTIARGSTYIYLRIIPLITHTLIVCLSISFIIHKMLFCIFSTRPSRIRYVHVQLSVLDCTLTGRDMDVRSPTFTPATPRHLEWCIGAHAHFFCVNRHGWKKIHGNGSCTRIYFWKNRCLLEMVSNIALSCKRTEVVASIHITTYNSM